MTEIFQGRPPPGNPPAKPLSKLECQGLWINSPTEGLTTAKCLVIPASHRYARYIWEVLNNLVRWPEDTPALDAFRKELPDEQGSDPAGG